MFHSMVQLQSGMMEDLYRAAQAGDTEQMKTLLRRGATVNSASAKRRFVQLAASSGDQELLKMFLQRGIALSDPSSSVEALHDAAEDGDAELVQLLLEHGARPHVNDVIRGVKDTALHLAVRGGHLATTQVLLDHCADVSSLSSTRRCTYGDQDAIDFFVDENVTPLHIAAEEGHFEVTKALLAKVPDIDACTEHGYTPLHLAVNENRDDIVRLLLEHGAKLSVLTKEGESVVDIATRRRHYKILKTLEEHMMIVMIATEVRYEEEERLFISSRIKRVPKRKPSNGKAKTKTSKQMRTSVGENGHSSRTTVVHERQTSNGTTTRAHGRTLQETRTSQDHTTGQGHVTGGLVLLKVERDEKNRQFEVSDGKSGIIRETIVSELGSEPRAASSRRDAKPAYNKSTPPAGSGSESPHVTGGLILLKVEKADEKTLWRSSTSSLSDKSRQPESSANNKDRPDGIVFSSFHTTGTGPAEDYQPVPSSPNSSFNSLEDRPIIDCSVKQQPTKTRVRSVEKDSRDNKYIPKVSQVYFRKTKGVSFESQDSIEEQSEEDERYHDAREYPKSKSPVDEYVTAYKTYSSYIYPIPPSIPYADEHIDDQQSPNVRYRDKTDDEIFYELCEARDASLATPNDGTLPEARWTEEGDIEMATHHQQHQQPQQPQQPISDVNGNYQNTTQVSMQESTHPKTTISADETSEDEDTQFQDALSSLQEVTPLIVAEENLDSASETFESHPDDSDDEYLNDRTMKAAISLMESKYSYGSQELTSDTGSEYEEADVINNDEIKQAFIPVDPQKCEIEDTSQSDDDNSTFYQETVTVTHTSYVQEVQRETPLDEVQHMYEDVQNTAVLADYSQDDSQTPQASDEDVGSEDEWTIHETYVQEVEEVTPSDKVQYIETLQHKTTITDHSQDDSQTGQVSEEDVESEEEWVTYESYVQEVREETPLDEVQDVHEQVQNTSSLADYSQDVTQNVGASDEDVGSEEEWTILEEYTVTETVYVTENKVSSDRIESINAYEPTETSTTNRFNANSSTQQITSSRDPDRNIEVTIPKTEMAGTFGPTETVRTTLDLQGQRDSELKEPANDSFRQNYHNTESPFTTSQIGRLHQTEVLVPQEDSPIPGHTSINDESLEFIDEGHSEDTFRLNPSEVLKGQKETHNDSETTEDKPVLSYYYKRNLAKEKDIAQSMKPETEGIMKHQYQPTIIVHDDSEQDHGPIDIREDISMRSQENWHGGEVNDNKIDQSHTPPRQQGAKTHNEDYSGIVSDITKKSPKEDTNLTYVKIIKPEYKEKTLKEQKRSSDDMDDEGQDELLFNSGKTIEAAVSYMNSKYDYDSGKDSSDDSQDANKSEKAELSTFEIPEETTHTFKHGEQLRVQMRPTELKKQSKTQDRPGYEIRHTTTATPGKVTIVTEQSSAASRITPRVSENVPKAKEASPRKKPNYKDQDQEAIVRIDKTEEMSAHQKRNEELLRQRLSGRPTDIDSLMQYVDIGQATQQKLQPKTQAKSNTEELNKQSKTSMDRPEYKTTTVTPTKVTRATEQASTTSFITPQIGENVPKGKESSSNKKQDQGSQEQEGIVIIDPNTITPIKPKKKKKKKPSRPSKRVSAEQDQQVQINDEDLAQRLKTAETAMRTHDALPTSTIEIISVSRSSTDTPEKTKSEVESTHSSISHKMQTGDKSNQDEGTTTNKPAIEIRSVGKSYPIPDVQSKPEEPNNSTEEEYIMDAVANTDQSEIVAKIDQIIIESLSTVKGKYKSGEILGESPESESTEKLATEETSEYQKMNEALNRQRLSGRPTEIDSLMQHVNIGQATRKQQHPETHIQYQPPKTPDQSELTENSVSGDLHGTSQQISRKSITKELKKHSKSPTDPPEYEDQATKPQQQPETYVQYQAPIKHEATDHSVSDESYNTSQQISNKSVTDKNIEAVTPEKKVRKKKKEKKEKKEKKVKTKLSKDYTPLATPEGDGNDHSQPSISSSAAGTTVVMRKKIMVPSQTHGQEDKAEADRESLIRVTNLDDYMNLYNRPVATSVEDTSSLIPPVSVRNIPANSQRSVQNTSIANPQPSVLDINVPGSVGINEKTSSWGSASKTSNVSSPTSVKSIPNMSSQGSIVRSQMSGNITSSGSPPGKTLKTTEVSYPGPAQSTSSISSPKPMETSSNIISPQSYGIKSKINSSGLVGQIPKVGSVEPIGNTSNIIPPISTGEISGARHWGSVPKTSSRSSPRSVERIPNVSSQGSTVSSQRSETAQKTAEVSSPTSVETSVNLTSPRSDKIKSNMNFPGLVGEIPKVGSVGPIGNTSNVNPPISTGDTSGPRRWGSAPKTSNVSSPRLIEKNPKVSSQGPIVSTIVSSLQPDRDTWGSVPTTSNVSSPRSIESTPKVSPKRSVFSAIFSSLQPDRDTSNLSLSKTPEITPSIGSQKSIDSSNVTSAGHTSTIDSSRYQVPQHQTEEKDTLRHIVDSVSPDENQNELQGTKEKVTKKKSKSKDKDKKKKSKKSNKAITAKGSPQISESMRLDIADEDILAGQVENIPTQKVSAPNRDLASVNYGDRNVITPVGIFATNDPKHDQQHMMQQTTITTQETSYGRGPNHSTYAKRTTPQTLQDSGGKPGSAENNPKESSPISDKNTHGVNSPGSVQSTSIVSARQSIENNSSLTSVGSLKNTSQGSVANNNSVGSQGSIANISDASSPRSKKTYVFTIIGHKSATGTHHTPEISFEGTHHTPEISLEGTHTPHRQGAFHDNRHPIEHHTGEPSLHFYEGKLSRSTTSDRSSHEVLNADQNMRTTNKGSNQSYEPNKGPIGLQVTPVAQHQPMRNPGNTFTSYDQSMEQRQYHAKTLKTPDIKTSVSSPDLKERSYQREYANEDLGDKDYDVHVRMDQDWNPSRVARDNANTVQTSKVKYASRGEVDDFSSDQRPHELQDGEGTPTKKKSKSKDKDKKKKSKKSKKKSAEDNPEDSTRVDIADEEILAGLGEDVPTQNLKVTTSNRSLARVNISDDNAVSPVGIAATSTPEHDQQYITQQTTIITTPETSYSSSRISSDNTEQSTPHRPSIQIFPFKRRKLSEKDPEDEDANKENQEFSKREAGLLRKTSSQSGMPITPGRPHSRDRRSGSGRQTDDSFTSPREAAKKSRPLSVPDVYVLAKFDKGSLSNLGVVNKDESIASESTGNSRSARTQQNVSFQTDPYFLDNSEVSQSGFDDSYMRTKSMDELDIDRPPRRPTGRSDQGLIRSQSGGALDDAPDAGWGSTQRQPRHREVVMPDSYLGGSPVARSNQVYRGEDMSRGRAGQSGVQFKPVDQVSVYHSQTHVGSPNYVNVTAKSRANAQRPPRPRNRSLSTEPSPGNTQNRAPRPRPRSAHEPRQVHQPRQAISVDAIPQQINMPIPKTRVSKQSHSKSLTWEDSMELLDDQPPVVAMKANPATPRHQQRPTSMPEQHTPYIQVQPSGVKHGPTFGRVPPSHLKGSSHPAPPQVYTQQGYGSPTYHQQSPQYAAGHQVAYQQQYRNVSPKGPAAVQGPVPKQRVHMDIQRTSPGAPEYPTPQPRDYNKRSSDPTALRGKLLQYTPPQDDQTDIW